jgi:hypothetical protein
VSTSGCPNAFVKLKAKGAAFQADQQKIRAIFNQLYFIFKSLFLFLKFSITQSF